MKSITEYHCCSECNKKIEIPGKHDSWEIGCTDPRGRPNKTGGLCRCELFKESKKKG